MKEYSVEDDRRRGEDEKQWRPGIAGHAKRPRRVGSVATILTTAVSDVARAMGGFATEIFEIRDSARRARQDHELDEDQDLDHDEVVATKAATPPRPPERSPSTSSPWGWTSSRWSGTRCTPPKAPPRCTFAGA